MPDQNTFGRDAHLHVPIPYAQLRQILGYLRLGPTDIVVDVGCGLGRVVCVTSRLRVRKVIGIEHDPDLAMLAERNVRSLRRQTSPASIVHADAAHCDLGGGTVFVLFNPFGHATMRAFLENLGRDLERDPRPIRIAYVNPTCQSLFQAVPWLRLLTVLESPMFRSSVSVWSTAGGFAESHRNSGSEALR